MTSEKLAPIEEGGNVDFSYEVAWVQTDKAFENRFDRYLDHECVRARVRASVAAHCCRTPPCACVCVCVPWRFIPLHILHRPPPAPSFFGHQIHWFSIFNSTMMVVFLCGLVSLILFRTLRNDYARYAKDGEMDSLMMGHGAGHIDHGITEDSGWKQVSGG